MYLPLSADAERQGGAGAAASAGSDHISANPLRPDESGKESAFVADPGMLIYALELDKLRFGPLGAVTGSAGRRLRSFLVSLPALWPLLLSLYTSTTAAYSFDGCRGETANGTVALGAAECVPCNGGRTYVQTDYTQSASGALFVGAFMSVLVVVEATWVRFMVEAAVSRARALLAYGVLVTHGAFSALLLSAVTTVVTILLIAAWVLRANSVAAVDALRLNGGEPCAVAGHAAVVLRPTFEHSNPLSPADATSA